MPFAPAGCTGVENTGTHNDECDSQRPAAGPDGGTLPKYICSATDPALTGLCVSQGSNAGRILRILDTDSSGESN